jgi:hypothetical protein
MSSRDIRLRHGYARASRDHSPGPVIEVTRISIFGNKKTKILPNLLSLKLRKKVRRII